MAVNICWKSRLNMSLGTIIGFSFIDVIWGALILITF